jgi:hypothetical protein
MTRCLTPGLARLAVLTLGVVAGAVAGFVALDRYLDPFDDRPFDPAAWAAAEGHEQERGPMARDAARHVPPGTPAELVRELLGKPDFVDTDNPPDKHGRRPKGYERWAYDLGSWSHYHGFDAASLDVHFDRGGRVVEAEITGG